MNKLFLLTVLNFLVIGAFAQGTPASPPATATGKLGDANATIKYAQPAVKGRAVWTGELAPYGKVWRTGANNATTFEIDKDVNVEGKALAAGKYALFSIPGEKEWTIIFNNKPAQWGAYSYKEANDVLRVNVPAHKAKEFVERFTISIADNKVNLAWENVSVDFTVK